MQFALNLKVYLWTRFNELFLAISVQDSNFSITAKEMTLDVFAEMKILHWEICK